MRTLKTISNRRSIRKFLSKPVPLRIMQKILQAGIDAPSAKNRQPWKFIIITEQNKPIMLDIIRRGIEQEKRIRMQPGHIGIGASSAENTLRVMTEAPVTVFIVNTQNKLAAETSREEMFCQMADMQSIGACIENMILAATAQGIGSLWICDIFSAYEGLCEWLGIDTQLAAAVSFGYTNEKPFRRPRKTQEECTEWK